MITHVYMQIVIKKSSFYKICLYRVLILQLGDKDTI